MPTIRAELSQYYAVKALFEQVLGRTAFMHVKDYAPLSAWCKNYIKLLRALGVAIEATVEIVDAEWKQEVSDLIAHGYTRLQHAKSIDELHAVAAATLGELAFLQLGFVPRGHHNTDNIPLTSRNWKMNAVRTVQYIQSKEQRDTQERLSNSKAEEVKP